MFAAQARRQQELLVEFLSVDIDLTFTILKTAEIEAGVCEGHSKAALGRARAGLQAIQRLSDRIEDPERRGEIQLRVKELAEAIAAFDPAPRSGGNQ